MSEFWDPKGPVDPSTAPAEAVTPDASTTAPGASPDGTAGDPSYGRAIPLPPVGGPPASTVPVPVSPGQWDPTGGYDPTGEQPSLASGVPTPPAGTWAPPPQSGWVAGAGAAGGAPPYFGWPPGGAPSPAAPAGPAKKRSGLAASLAAVIVVVAVVAGVGLGHAVWPTTSTTSSAASPSAGSGSSGSGSSPFGSGSGSGSYPFGSGSSGSGSSSSGSGSSSSSGSTSTGAGAPSDISAIAAKVSPGLVDINTNLSYENEQAAGTGMVLTSTGEILTNNHVIDGATSISVTDVGNGKTYSASVVGYDRTADVAVIKLSGASGLQTVDTASAPPRWARPS